MSLLDQKNLAAQPEFQARVGAAAVHAALAIVAETVTDQQTISMGAVTAGTFTITFMGQTTAAQQWNSSAITIQIALNALSTIGAGGVECTGGPLPGTPVVVNFIGSSLIGGQPLITHTDTLTGGVATVAHTTVGTWVANHAKRAMLAKLILGAAASYGQSMALGVADNAVVQVDFPGPNYTPNNGVIAGATNASPIVITTATPHGLVNGQLVNISGVVGNTNANGLGLTVTVVSPTTFSIGVAGNGAYTSGGTFTLSEATITNDVQFQMNSIIGSYA